MGKKKKIKPKFRIRSISFIPFPKSFHDLETGKNGTQISTHILLFCGTGFLQGPDPLCSILSPHQLRQKRFEQKLPQANDTCVF